MISIGV